MSNFKREPRYIVFKLKDIKKYIGPDFEAMETLYAFGNHITAGRIADGKLPFNAVVVEQDWPEFEPTWEAIEARMTGKPSPATSLRAEVERLRKVYNRAVMVDHGHYMADGDIHQIEMDNDALRAEVEALAASLDANWVTHQRVAKAEARVAELEAAIGAPPHVDPAYFASLIQPPATRRLIIPKLVAWLESPGESFRTLLPFLDMDYQTAYEEGWMDFTNAVFERVERTEEHIRARIAALEAALDRYGMHLPSCEMLPDDPDRDDPHCTCGLNKALRGEANHD